MSMYGPQSGPYPGQPQDSWQDGPAHDLYGSADPYDRSDRGRPTYTAGYHDDPRYTDAHYGDLGYADPSYADPRWGDQQQYPDPPPDLGRPSGPAEEWGPPEPTQRRDGDGRTFMGVMIVLAILILGGGAAAYMLTRGRSTSASPSARPSGGSTSTLAPSASAAAPPVTPGSSRPSGPASGSVPASRSIGAGTDDARTAKVGDCLVNRGPAVTPKMQKVACAPSTYEVLRKIDGTADRNRCDGTPRLTDWYFYDHSDNAQDFVLCLRKR